MKVDGMKEFDAPAQVVWDVLNDPVKMAQLLPGVQGFDVQDDSHWTADVKVPLGMGGLALKLKFEKTEQRPIEYARLAAKGQGVGAIVNQQVTNVLNALERQIGDAKGAAASGAEAGIHPATPEAYAADAEGPTHSTG